MLDKKSATLPRSSPSSSYNRERRCLACAVTFIGKSFCPYCGSITQITNGDEMLRKTFDAPDLKKGF